MNNTQQHWSTGSNGSNGSNGSSSMNRNSYSNNPQKQQQGMYRKSQYGSGQNLAGQSGNNGVPYHQHQQQQQSYGQKQALHHRTNSYGNNPNLAQLGGHRQQQQQYGSSNSLSSMGSNGSHPEYTTNSTNQKPEVILDEKKMYYVNWLDNAPFGFIVIPIQSDRGTVLLLTRRTIKTDLLRSSGLQEVVPGDILVGIGAEKVFDLGFDNATRYLKCVQRPVRLMFQLSPYGNDTATANALAPNEYVYTWREGSLGLVLSPDDQLKIPVVKKITAKPENTELYQKISLGDHLIYVNDIATCEYHMSAIMHVMQTLPKPIQLRFRKPLTNDDVELPPLSENEYEFLWEYGPLGLVVGVSKEGLPFVRNFTGKGTSPQLSMVQEHDEIILVNDKSAIQMGFNGIMNYLMHAPKPTLLRFRRHGRKQERQSTYEEGVLPPASFASIPPGSSYASSSSASSLGPMGQLPLVPPPLQASNNQLEDSLQQQQQQRRFSSSGATSSFASIGSNGSGNSTSFGGSSVDEKGIYTLDPKAMYTVQWSGGPFGFTVREVNSTHGPVLLITKRTGKSTCAGLRRVAVGDILIQIGEQYTLDLGFEKSALELRNVPKPVYLKFQAIHFN